MAASSPLGASLVWKTTPKEPLPTILHWVYCISRVSPVTPSWTFSRITSTCFVSPCTSKSYRNARTAHAKAAEIGSAL